MTDELRIGELIEYIARRLVDEPDRVEVRVVDRDRAKVYQLSVAERDLGKVIGKDGRTARAIRTLVAAAAARSGTRVILDILE